MATILFFRECGNHPIFRECGKVKAAVNKSFYNFAMKIILCINFLHSTLLSSKQKKLRWSQRDLTDIFEVKVETV